jgi:hypothetical protein
MKLGTHMPGGERRKTIDIEDRRICVETFCKVKKFGFKTDLITTKNVKKKSHAYVSNTCV